MSELENFLSGFRDPETKKFKTLTGSEFLKCWRHYDTNGNGYLEAEELDAFLVELVSSVTDSRDTKCLSESALKVLKEDILAAYDEDGDGRIDMSEMAKILPMEEVFMAIFEPQNKLKSSIEFIRIWREFDKDNNGYIEGDEITKLIHSLLKRAGKDIDDEEKLKEYANVIMNLFDNDGDQRLKISEMSRLLKVEENFLKKPVFRSTKKISYVDFDRVFLRYDLDKNGFLENEELEGFLKDLVEATELDHGNQTIDEIKNTIMAQWDKNGDGKIGRKELETLLIHTIRLNESMDAIKRGMDCLEHENSDDQE